MEFSLCVYFCVQISPFHKDTVLLDDGPTLLQYDLILTDYICHNPIFPIRSYFEVVGVGTFNTEVLRVRNSTPFFCREGMYNSTHNME